MHFFLSLSLRRYFWKPKNANIKGIQFNSPKNIKDELLERLFIEFLSKKLRKAPIKSKNELAMKIKLILSLKIFSWSYQKLITKENNKNIIDNEIADGNKNKPMKKENLPKFSEFLKIFLCKFSKN